LFDKKLQGGYISWEEQEKPPCLHVSDEMYEWPPFGHESIEHEPFTALEQWKACRHRSLWLVVSNWAMSKWTFYVKIIQIERWFYNYFINTILYVYLIIYSFIFSFI